MHVDVADTELRKRVASIALHTVYLMFIFHSLVRVNH